MRQWWRCSRSVLGNVSAERLIICRNRTLLNGCKQINRGWRFTNPHLRDLILRNTSHRKFSYSDKIRFAERRSFCYTKISEHQPKITASFATLLAIHGYGHQGCGVGVEPDFFVRLRLRKSHWIIFYITLLSWEFLWKWYNFLWIFCWNREFLLCTTISLER